MVLSVNWCVRYICKHVRSLDPCLQYRQINHHIWGWFPIGCRKKRHGQIRRWRHPIHSLVSPMLLSMAKVISATDECALTDWDLRLHVTKSSLAHGIASMRCKSGHSCLGNCAWSWNYTDCQNNGECYLFCLLVFSWRPNIWDCLCQNNVSCGRFLVFNPEWPISTVVI